MSDKFAVDGMALDVLSLIRNQQSSLHNSSNVPGFDAIVRIAGPVSCLVYGHPDQPRRRLKRFRQQPWRCDRCETWWVTEHYTDYGNHDTGGAWRWIRVDDN